MTLLGSGSALYRTLECPASVHLPPTEKPARVKRAGERGTAIHTYCQFAPEDGPKALDLIPEQYHALCKAIPLDQLPHKRTPLYLREAAYAHHGQTGQVRELDVDGHRDYGTLDQYETPLTVDVVIRGYYMAEVWDLKTGRTPVPPPAENPQLLHGALCVSETVAPMAEKFVVGIATLGADGQVHPEAAIIDRWDLEQHEGRIRLAQRKALRVVQAIKAGVEPEVNPGVWCKWCDAKATCPAMR